MRIAHVLNEAVATGNGIVNATVDLACTQASAGHEVCLVSSGGGYLDLLSRFNVRHYTVNLRPSSALKLARDLPRLKCVIKRARPEIVHAHTVTAAVLMRIGRAAAGFGNFGLVTTVHNEWRRSANLMRLSDGVIVLSQHGRTELIARGFLENKVRVVQHGILNSPRRDGKCGVPEQRQASDAGGPQIVTMAGLYVRKGIIEIMRAFGQIADQFPTASLQILGWGPGREMFEAQKKWVKGGDRIHFRGFVADPRPILRQASVFVLASHAESFSLAIAEAREAGCAIVATAVGGVPELLEQGRAGRLIAPRDAEALAEALRDLLSDPGELTRWRQAARSNLDWLSCTRAEKETMDVYAAVLRQRALLGSPRPRPV